MNCKYQSRKLDVGPFTCSLGWYNGKPHYGNCIKCMADGKNTPEAFDKENTQGVKDSSKQLPQNGEEILLDGSGSCCNQKMPSKTTMFKTFAGAIKDEGMAMLRGDNPVSKEDYVSRVDICNSCEFLQGDRCTKCGCFIKVKAAMRTQNCPIGKW